MVALTCPLRVTASNSCGSGTPVELIVNVFEAAPLLTPSVTVSGRILTATLAPAEQSITAYQWYKDGNTIAGQTNQNYTVPDNETGSYTAAYSNACGAGVPSSPTVIAVVRNNQTITFTPVAPKTFGDASFVVTATASSGLPVVYSIVSGPGTITENNITITGAGTIVVKAFQEGSPTFNEAAATLNIIINKTAASVALSNLIFTYDGTEKRATAVTTPLGLNAAVTYNGSSGAPVNAGVYSISAVITSANYQGFKDSSLTINKASQTIALQSIPTKSFNDAPFNVTAISSSTLPVTISITTIPASGVANINGNTITIVGGGSVTVNGTQTGNINYDAATLVQTSFTITPPAKKDIEVVSLVSPLGGCGLGTQADITIKIKNTGTQAATGFPISYSINNGTIITETVNSNIASGNELNYTFITKGNFPNAGQLYQIKIYTALTGDERVSNDTLLQSVTRFAAPVVSGASSDTSRVASDARGNGEGRPWPAGC